MLIYANLRSPGRDPGVQSAFFIFFLNNIIFFFFFFHVPSGASYLYFSHSNFFIFSPFPGHQMFIFWPVENCTTWNLRYLMLRDAGWALRHWRSCSKFCSLESLDVWEMIHVVIPCMSRILKIMHLSEHATDNENHKSIKRHMYIWKLLIL